jgi:hypothetical protein
MSSKRGPAPKKIELDFNGYSNNNDQPQSFGLNVSDPRFDNRIDVASYYGDPSAPLINNPIQADLLDYDVVIASPIFALISQARASGQTIDDAWLVDQFPDLARVLYPGGEIAWAEEDDAKYRPIQADILAREAILSGVIRLDTTANGAPVERLDSYDDFDTIRRSVTFQDVKDQIAAALAKLSIEDRKAAIDDNILLEKLTWEDQQFFAGLFKKLFNDLNSDDVKAYQRASDRLASALEVNASYLNTFDPAANVIRAGVADDLAMRMAIGAAVKTHALTKTIAAEGRYGDPSFEYFAWFENELEHGGSVAQTLPNGLVAIIGNTPTAGENTTGAGFGDLMEQTLEINDNSSRWDRTEAA